MAKSQALLILTLAIMFSAAYGSRLTDDLFTSYSRRERPTSSPLTVNVEIDWLTIKNVTSKRPPVLEAHGNLRVKWTDSRLAWDTEEYENEDDILRPSVNQIWKPDVKFQNESNENIGSSLSSGSVLLTSEGTVYWSTNFAVSFDHKSGWTADESIVTLTLGSSIYSANEMDVRAVSSSGTQYVRTTSPCTLTSNTVEHKVVPFSSTVSSKSRRVAAVTLRIRNC